MKTPLMLPREFIELVGKKHCKGEWAQGKFYEKGFSFFNTENFKLVLKFHAGPMKRSFINPHDETGGAA